MGLFSILLSALAVVCAGVGVLTTPIPKLGLVFAFGAPVLALAGIMLGGSAMSTAKKAGQTSETGKIGAILSALAFVPSVVVALTCGVCNAFFSTGNMQVQKDFHFGVAPFGPTAGADALPPPQRADRNDSNAGTPADSDATQDLKGTQRQGSHLKPTQRPGQQGVGPGSNPRGQQGAAPGPTQPGQQGEGSGSSPLPPPPLPPGPGR